MKRAICGFLSAMSAAGVFSAAGDAAAVNCADLPAPIYVAGSSAAKPFLAEIGKIVGLGSPPVTLVYRAQGSCVGVEAIVIDKPVTGAGATAAIYWDGAGAELKCDLPVDGVQADIGISDVYADTCGASYSPLPESVEDYPGPIQVMTFAVPKASTEQAISREAAYFVFGFGNDSGVAPWTNEAGIFRRSASSGTQQMLAHGIGVPAAQWRGTATTNSDDMQSKLAACGLGADPSQCIGILGTDAAQDNFSLRVLAYQHENQSCAYLPDEDNSPVSPLVDKRNVRNGHYPIWGPMHVLARVSINTGEPVKQEVKDIIDYLIGAKQLQGLNWIDLVRSLHLVPRCAMRVDRLSEMGPLSSFLPKKSCACAFDAVPECQSCVTDADCPAETPACNYGYCEIQ